MQTPIPIQFIVDNTLHRGYRDESGRFTLEQCNLSKANAADNLRELDGTAIVEVPRGTVKCQNCFVGDTFAEQETGAIGEGQIG